VGSRIVFAAFGRLLLSYHFGDRGSSTQGSFLLSVAARGLIGVPQKPLRKSALLVAGFRGFQSRLLAPQGCPTTFCLWGAVSIVTAMTRRR
jgi:hypothetical protein